MSPFHDPDRWFDVLAAFGGSAIVLFIRRTVDKWEAAGIVFTAIVTAYFGTEYLSGFLPAGAGVRGVAGLGLGVLSYYLFRRAVAFARRGELPVIGKEGSDDRG